MNVLKLAEKYDKSNPGEKKKSKLDKYEEAISYLYKNNHTILSIQAFLKNELKFDVAYSTLRDYCDRRFNNQDTLKEKAKLYDEIENHCMLLKNKYLDETEKKENYSVISLINHFIQIGQNSNIKIIEKNNNETSSGKSMFSEIGS
jgi:hypothetical protein